MMELVTSFVFRHFRIRPYFIQVFFFITLINLPSHERPARILPCLFRQSHFFPPQVVCFHQHTQALFPLEPTDVITATPCPKKAGKGKPPTSTVDLQKKGSFLGLLIRSPGYKSTRWLSFYLVPLGLHQTCICLNTFLEHHQTFHNQSRNITTSEQTTKYRKTKKKKWQSLRQSRTSSPPSSS